MGVAGLCFANFGTGIDDRGSRIVPSIVPSIVNTLGGLRYCNNGIEGYQATGGSQAVRMGGVAHVKPQCSADKNFIGRFGSRSVLCWIPEYSSKLFLPMVVDITFLSLELRLNQGVVLLVQRIPTARAVAKTMLCIVAGAQLFTAVAERPDCPDRSASSA